MPPARNSQIRALSRACRAILIEHIDGPIPIRRHGDGPLGLARKHRINELLCLGLLRNEAPGPFPARPRALILSSAGRAAVSLILADEAEALVGERPMVALQRLKAQKRPSHAIPGLEAPIPPPSRLPRP